MATSPGTPLALHSFTHLETLAALTAATDLVRKGRFPRGFIPTTSADVTVTPVDGDEVTLESLVVGAVYPIAIKSVSAANAAALIVGW